MLGLAIIELNHPAFSLHYYVITNSIDNLETPLERKLTKVRFHVVS